MLDFTRKKDDSHTPVPSCALPVMTHCVMGLRLDGEADREHIIMGEMRDISLYLCGYEGFDKKLLVDELRPMGTMVEEMFGSRSLDTVDAISGMLPGVGGQRPDLVYKAGEVLEALYESGNLLWKYAALRMWQEYQSNGLTADFETLRDTLEAISYPLRVGHKRQIEMWQNVYSYSNLAGFLGAGYFEHPAYLMYQTGRPLTKWVVTDLSVIPLYVHYLDTVYTNRGFFQYCKRCGKMYIAHTAKIKGFCGEECRRAQQKENRRRYSDKVVDDDAERSYRTTYMYWYNRMKKLRLSPNVEREKLAELEKAFSAFREEATRRKRAVQKDPESDEGRSFSGWLLKQRNYFDRLTDGME